MRTLHFGHNQKTKSKTPWNPEPDFCHVDLHLQLRFVFVCVKLANPRWRETDKFLFLQTTSENTAAKYCQHVSITIIQASKKAASLQAFLTVPVNNHFLCWSIFFPSKRPFRKIFSYYRLLDFSKWIGYLISGRFTVSLPSREFTPIGCMRSHLVHCGVVYPPRLSQQSSFCQGEGNASSNGHGFVLVNHRCSTECMRGVFLGRDSS